MKQADVGHSAIKAGYRISVIGLTLVGVVILGVFGLAFFLADQTIIFELLKYLGGAGLGSVVTVAVQSLVKQGRQEIEK